MTRLVLPRTALPQNRPRRILTGYKLRPSRCVAVFAVLAVFAVDKLLESRYHRSN
jgi:hypothetical protein